MVTISLSGLAALDSLRLGPRKTTAEQLAKLERRTARIAAFESTIRSGLAYSRTVGKRLTKHKGDGGARLEHQMRRIMP